ncbi:hypothetical protein [Flavobacterium sp.]|uniref:hypothetical protein n=1 Tax=Flavobacterium sp. TaxID=239 RepID=UPI003B99D1BB
MDKETIFEKLHLRYVTPIIAILTAIYSFCFTISEKKLNEIKSNIDILAQETDTKIKIQEFNNQLKFKLYEEVKFAINNKSSKNDSLVALMLYSLLDSTEIDFQRNLLSLLSAKNSPVVEKIVVENANFLIEQAKPLRTDKFTVDIFYFEDNLSISLAKSEKIERLLRISYPEFVIRKRLLPQSINVQQGYRISTNQIRFEKGTNEDDLSQEISKLIRDSKIPIKQSFLLHPVFNKTQNYISIFVRNE